MKDVLERVVCTYGAKACDAAVMALDLCCQLTLYGHIKTAEQRTIVQQYDDWYTDR